MKVSKQYNDFIGKAVADISEHSNLMTYLNSRGVDTQRFEPIGASFYHSYANLLAFISYALTADNQPIMNHI